jgi:hypothetical protein
MMSTNEHGEDEGKMHLKDNLLRSLDGRLMRLLGL